MQRSVRQRYNKEFKARAVEQAEAAIGRGEAMVDVARRLGVASHAIYNWREQASGKSRERRERQRVRKVLVVPDKEATLVKPTRGPVCVVGLDITGIAELLRQLG